MRGVLRSELRGRSAPELTLSSPCNNNVIYTWSYSYQLGPEAVRDSTGCPVVGLIPHTGANKWFKGINGPRKLRTDFTMKTAQGCRRSRKMEGVRRGPPNALRHHGEEKEEEEVIHLNDHPWCLFRIYWCHQQKDLWGGILSPVCVSNTTQRFKVIVDGATELVCVRMWIGFIWLRVGCTDCVSCIQYSWTW
jgi:hypothetical protein